MLFSNEIRMKSTFKQIYKQIWRWNWITKSATHSNQLQWKRIVQMILTMRKGFFNKNENGNSKEMWQIVNIRWSSDGYVALLNGTEVRSTMVTIGTGNKFHTFTMDFCWCNVHIIHICVWIHNCYFPYCMVWMLSFWRYCDNFFSFSLHMCHNIPLNGEATSSCVDCHGTFYTKSTNLKAHMCEIQLPHRKFTTHLMYSYKANKDVWRVNWAQWNHVPQFKCDFISDAFHQITYWSHLFWWWEQEFRQPESKNHQKAEKKNKLAHKQKNYVIWYEWKLRQKERLFSFAILFWIRTKKKGARFDLFECE